MHHAKNRYCSKYIKTLKPVAGDLIYLFLKAQLC